MPEIGTSGRDAEAKPGRSKSPRTRQGREMQLPQE